MFNAIFMHDFDNLCVIEKFPPLRNFVDLVYFFVLKRIDIIHLSYIVLGKLHKDDSSLGWDCVDDKDWHNDYQHRK